MRETFLNFIIIFLAALPGRTTFILLLLASTMKPWRILIGAIPAFAVQCILAVTFGQAVKTLPQIYIRFCAGMLFLFFARKFWMELKKSNVQVKPELKRSISSVFVLFFLAELGDVSQLAIASRAVQSNCQSCVLFGSIAAMSAIALLAVLAGRMLATKLKLEVLQKIASVTFIAIGAYLILSSAFELVANSPTKPTEISAPSAVST